MHVNASKTAAMKNMTLVRSQYSVFVCELGRLILEVVLASPLERGGFQVGRVG